MQCIEASKFGAQMIPTRMSQVGFDSRSAFKFYPSYKGRRDDTYHF